jgi:hypothetical protein
VLACVISLTSSDSKSRVKQIRTERSMAKSFLASLFLALPSPPQLQSLLGRRKRQQQQLSEDDEQQSATCVLYIYTRFQMV